MQYKIYDFFLFILKCNIIISPLLHGYISIHVTLILKEKRVQKDLNCFTLIVHLHQSSLSLAGPS